MSAEERYRGQRRAAEPTTVSRRPRVALVGALLLVLVAALAMRAMAAGEPPPADHTPSPAAHPPLAGASRPAPSVAGSSRTAGKSDAPGKDPVLAVPPTASPVPPPEPPTTAYEAEAGANTFGLGLDVRSLPAASGGSVVVNISDRRTLRFNGVTAQAGGGGTLVVFYATNSDRTGWLRVDDGGLQPVSYPSTGGFGRIGSITVRIELLVGINTIEFGGSSPALDRITVREDAGNLV